MHQRVAIVQGRATPVRCADVIRANQINARRFRRSIGLGNRDTDTVWQAAFASSHRAISIDRTNERKIRYRIQERATGSANVVWHVPFGSLFTMPCSCDDSNCDVKNACIGYSSFTNLPCDDFRIVVAVAKRRNQLCFHYFVILFFRNKQPPGVENRILVFAQRTSSALRRARCSMKRAFDHDAPIASPSSIVDLGTSASDLSFNQQRTKNVGKHIIQTSQSSNVRDDRESVWRNDERMHAPIDKRIDARHNAEQIRFLDILSITITKSLAKCCDNTKIIFFVTAANFIAWVRLDVRQSCYRRSCNRNIVIIILEIKKTPYLISFRSSSFR